MIIPRTRAIVFRTDTSEACVARRSSKKEHRVNALALGADERRGKLRKASGRRKQPSIRRFLNGETYLSKPQVYLRFAQVGFPIQKSPDRWLFAPPRSFSQLTTSFIGSQCQGIHPVLFLAWPSCNTSFACVGSKNNSSCSWNDHL